MNTKGKNLLELFLEQLKVKFTKTYVNKLYGESSHGHSLFEMSKMLSNYSIKNAGVRLNDKNELLSLETPFLVEIDNDVAIVHKITTEHAHCRWRESDIVAPLEEFKNVWNGVALLAEKTKATEEPGYKENLKKHLFHTFQKYTSILSIIVILCIGFIKNELYTNPETLLLLFVNLIGAYIGYLLIQKQLYIPNNHADKICSLLKKGSCNDVLNSPAAKILGIIGWSEVGLSYFISNIFIAALFPPLIAYLALINLCVLPYSFWSVWYQRFRAKQWCLLCLIVQILLWTNFIINLIFGFLKMPHFILVDILVTGIIYTIPLLTLSLALPMVINKKRLQWTTEQMNSLRMKPEVFETLLKQQPHYKVDLSASQIIWGNVDASMLITIATNPHCEPCGMIHKEVERLLKIAGNDICVQYIFTSFREDLESSGIFLTEIYLSNEIGKDQKKEIYNEWFEKGKYNRDDFFRKYAFSSARPISENESNNHKEWIELNNIRMTPTILVNGYELPRDYKVEDLFYFTGLKI